MSYLVGVDGGDTGCRAAISDTSGKILAQAQGGPANERCIDTVGYQPASGLYLLGGLGASLIEFMLPDYSHASVHPGGMH